MDSQQPSSSSIIYVEPQPLSSTANGEITDSSSTTLSYIDDLREQFAKIVEYRANNPELDEPTVVPSMLSQYQSIDRINILALSKNSSTSITLEQFLLFAKVDFNDPRYLFFFNLNNVDCVTVDDNVLEWLGFTGERKTRKDSFRRLLDTNSIPYEKVSKEGYRVCQYDIVMKPDDLKQAIMTCSTRKCREIRNIFITMEKVVRLYMEYNRIRRLNTELQTIERKLEMANVAKSVVEENNKGLMNKLDVMVDKLSFVADKVCDLSVIAAKEQASRKRAIATLGTDIVPCTVPKVACPNKQNQAGLYRIVDVESVKRLLARTCRMTDFEDEASPFYPGIIAGWYAIRTQKRNYKNTEKRLIEYTGSEKNIRRIALREIGHAIQTINLMKDKLHRVHPSEYKWDARGNTLVMIYRSAEQVGQNITSINGIDLDTYISDLFNDCINDSPATSLMQELDNVETPGS